LSDLSAVFCGGKVNDQIFLAIGRGNDASSGERRPDIDASVDNNTELMEKEYIWWVQGEER